MRTGCRWTGLLDGDVCFELRLPRADFRQEQAGSVSTVAPTDDNIFVHRTCFRFTCCTTGLQEYHETTNIPISLSIRDPWLTFILSFFSFHLFRRISRDKSANSRRETSEFPMNDDDELSSMHKERVRSEAEFFDLGIPPVVKVWLLP